MSDTLKDAYLLFSKKKYSDVIRILEPQVFRFRENFNFFYILGMSCLNQGDYGGAFSYLRRAGDIRENDLNTLLGLAVIYLKRGDTGNALRLWLDIIDVGWSYPIEPACYLCDAGIQSGQAYVADIAEMT